MSRLLLAAALVSITLAASPAAAATLGLPTLASPLVTAVGEASNAPGLFDFEFTAAGATSSAPAAAFDLDVDIVAEILPDGSVGALGGVLLVGPGPEAGGLFLSAELNRVGFVFGPGEDRLEFLFDVVAGAAAYGPQVLAVVLGAFGDDAASAFGPNGFAPTEASLEIRPLDVAAIPLPATLPLALGGLAILAGLARRRRV